MITDPGGHLLAMGAFGYLGYWAHIWDEHAQVLIAEKQREIKERQARLQERRQAAVLAVMQEVEGQQTEASGDRS